MSDERDVSPSGPGNIKLSPKIIITVVVVIIAIFLVVNSVYVVDQTERGVVLLMGKYNRTAQPGLHFKIPFLEKNYNVPTQKIRTETFGYRSEQPGVQSTYSSQDFPEESIMLTGDLNIVDVEWVIQYRINEPRKWLFNVAANNRKKTIRDISQSVINRLVGDRAILDIMGSERPSIEVEGKKSMNTILDSYGLGVEIQQVKLQDIVPPKGEVQDAFEDVNKAIQDMNRFINEGRKEYNNAIAEARGQKDQIIQEAEGYAQQRINNAQGDVARFLSVLTEYKQAPDVTETRLYIEMMEDIFEDTEGTNLIAKDLENFLPLKSLQGGTASGTVTAPQSGGSQ